MFSEKVVIRRFPVNTFNHNFFLPSSAYFVLFDTEFMFYSFIAEFTRQVKTVRMLILRPIILSVVKSVPSLPFKAIVLWTAIHSPGKSVSPGWPFKLYLQRKKLVFKQSKHLEIHQSSTCIMHARSCRTFIQQLRCALSRAEIIERARLAMDLFSVRGFKFLNAWYIFVGGSLERNAR